MEQTRRLPQGQRRDAQRELPIPEAPRAPAPAEQEQIASVQVISGASVQTLPLAGLEVSQARDLVATILQIDPGSPVLVNGEPVSSGQRLTDGDTLEFVHHAGEKGGQVGPSH